MSAHLLKNSSKIKIKNIVISGTNFWNPGDDFVRDGVICILRKLFEGYTLNFLFYNFNQDFYPQSKFSGIHNMAAAGDLNKYRDFVDAVVIAGLSAGKEIKDLYNWIIENGLLDRVYLIGAGYANTYVDKNISQEPEATVFRNARVITGRTEKKSNFIAELGLPYHHINCPAMLSVENVKDIPDNKSIETIGFSIQLPHRVGVVNHCCDASMYKLAAHTLLELLPRYNIEIIAHHKEEYFHFLNLVKGHDIPVFFSSFYHDLFDIYGKYDLVISTRLHTCIFANSHGIPAIIVNDTDRHTHCAEGFPHLTWVNTREKLHQELESICRQDLRRIANDNKEFKEKLMQKYLTVLAEPFSVTVPVAKKPLFDKLNVGCGSDYRQGFVNIDGNPNLPKVDYILDIKPGVLLEHFEPGSFNYILAQDFLEHHFHWETRRLLEDFHVLLSSKGQLDIRLPNIEAVVNDPHKDIAEKVIYLYGGQDMQQRWETSSPNSSRQRYPQYFCHKYGWTPESIRSELLSVGFLPVEITREGWNMRIVAEKNSITSVQVEDQLPVHFFTIVLNGQPFIRHHIEVFKQLPFKWHWHIIEGVADLKHDTAWSVELGGRINEQLHRNGLSNDGTAEYIDELARQYPENITVYRKPEGVFWDGKLEMVNAPLADISEECLLWQVDSDELWTTEQICTCRDMFIAEPDRTAAFYLDHFFVGENLITTTINTYGNNTGYEWLRTWRFRPGFLWTAHEPPRLCMHGRNGEWVDITTIKPFKHDETSAKKLIFQHYAYATEKQLAFKEIYYGYKNAVEQWQHLQQHRDFPVFLKEYFGWVKDGAQVNTIRSQNITPLAWKDTNGQWRFSSCQPAQKQQITRLSKDHKKILIVRPDAIGDFVIFSGVLKHFRDLYKDAELTILTQEHIAELALSCPHIDDVITFDRKRLVHDQAYTDSIIEELKSRKFDTVIQPVYSRDEVGDFLTLNSGADTKIASAGDGSNMPLDKKLANNSIYTRLIPASDKPMLETVRNVEFINNLALRNVCEQCAPKVWIQREDETNIDELLSDLNIENPIVICPFSQHAIKDWPLWKWVELISKYKDHPIVICGSEKNGSKADGLINLLDHDNLHNLCGRITLRQLGALLKRSRVCVGVDTGSVHIAAAVECPQVVITGGGHFGRFIPYSPGTTLVYLPMKCYQCNWRCKYNQARCITQIRVETVDLAVRQALDNSRATRSEPVLIEENLKIDSVPTESIQFSLKPLADVDISEIDKDSKYLVTAIVSTYNAERLIAGCLEDLENQTIANRLEIIVVNSGSQENEEATVREYQQKYNNIVYIKTEQREGIYAAWNRAVEGARGTFLTNANTDDRHREDALEIMASTLLENPDIALVYGDQICTDTPNATLANHHAAEMAKKPDYSRERLLFGCCVGSQPMWRKSLHYEFGYFDDSLTCAGDWDFWLRISDKYKFKHIPEFLGLYFHNQEGIEHGRKIHSLYERYMVGRRYGNPYISVIPLYKSKGSPLVSVIMPAYNAADYIAEAIESVLIQNYRNFELIVVDDGSTDSTKDIITSFKDNKIKSFHKENAGPASARNLAIKKSKGAFIIFLDTDDMMTPDFIAKHLQEFENDPEADLVYCDDCLIDENDKPIRVINRPEYTSRKLLIRDLFCNGFPIVPFRTCLRRSVFDKIGFFDESLLVGEDYDMMRRFVKQGLKIRHLTGALYLRRIAGNSLSRNYSAQKAKCHFDVVRRFTDTFAYDELFPDLEWDKIAPEMRQLHAKCLAAGTYLAIGREYIKTNATEYSRTAFDQACLELNDCLKIDPENQRLRKLLQKSELIRARYIEVPEHVLSK
ncbi:MAG: glycosyltransferase [Planctomycetota bacterium]|jgi:glycosyltransferase involved in cell wall biosynthesis/ADP-heptose:LPS heptosyltransferase